MDGLWVAAKGYISRVSRAPAGIGGLFDKLLLPGPIPWQAVGHWLSTYAIAFGMAAMALWMLRSRMPRPLRQFVRSER